MSPPIGLRGTSSVLRSVARPQVLRAAPASWRLKSSMALDGQQQVSRLPRGWMALSCGDKVNANCLTPSCSLHISRRQTRQSSTLSSRFVPRCHNPARSSEGRSEADGFCDTGEEEAEALHQPHSLRKLHLPGRSRCAWQCYAKYDKILVVHSALPGLGGGGSSS